MHPAAEELRTYRARAAAMARAILIFAALLGWAMLVTRYVGFLMNPGPVWVVWLTMMVPLFWIVMRSPRL
jgi:hypothetical protein